MNPYSIYNENRQAWNNSADAWRGHAASLRLSLSQSQHEAEKAKGEIAALRSMYIVIDTPNDICDGHVCGTVDELTKQYGPDAIKWTMEPYDWNERVERYKLSYMQEKEIARLQSELAGVRKDARLWFGNDGQAIEMEPEQVTALRKAAAVVVQAVGQWYHYEGRDNPANVNRIYDTYAAFNTLRINALSSRPLAPAEVKK